ncbi:hypothetical protein [Moraxella sp. K2450]|uniref:hypothetical protein n=1 Tax=Moraxella sp. K2450 TaxID=2780076 RepID=UPI00187EA1F2|nr:hypothetical protein [Moraxella sp. K2450]MBE9597147.1 hypothetical protein [Moraxella sp. K2450]
MNEVTTPKIPLKVLMACMLSTAKQDVREYLTYVKVQNGYVASTDGHRMLVCDIDGLDKELDIFIPPMHIKDLYIGLGKKDRNDDVEISIKEYDDDKIVTMQYRNRFVRFINPTFSKFPDVKKKIPSDDELVDCMPRFNAQFVLDMQKVADLIGKSYMKILPTGKEIPMLIKFPTSDLKIVGIIMPMRG